MDVCRIQFKKVGKKYYFNPNGIEIKDKDMVVVETVRGLEIGEVVGGLVPCPSELEKDIKPILRIATKKDLENHEHNRKNEIIALEKCGKLIRKNKLEMKLLYCEYTLDKQKLIIYFESEDRVDFRQLVKDLAEEFRVSTKFEKWWIT